MDKAMFTVNSLRTSGEWSGDIVMIADPDNFLNSVSRAVKLYDLILFPHPTIDLEPLVSSTGNFRADWKLNTSEGAQAWRPRDDRQWEKKLQWQKLLLFHEFFARWRMLVYLDAGTHVFLPVEVALEEWRPMTSVGYVIAREDSQSIAGQLDETLCRPCYDAAVASCPNIMTRYSLQTGILAFETEWHIKGASTLAGLLKKMIETPIWYTNEQALLAMQFQCESADYIPIRNHNEPNCTATDVFIRGPHSSLVDRNMYRARDSPLCAYSRGEVAEGVSFGERRGKQLLKEIVKSAGGQVAVNNRKGI